MSFSKWETKKDFVNNLKLIQYDGKEKLNLSGIPMGFEDDSIYLDTRTVHSLVIGSKGCGKHQAIVLPMIDSICASGESAIISDHGFEMYDLTHEMFENNGYKVFKFNFDYAIDTNNWNPFSLAKYYYDAKDYDMCQDVIDNIGFYFLYEYEPHTDPFWINSTISYFKGLALYALKTKGDITINDIYLLNEEAKNNRKDLLSKIGKDTPEYAFLSNILNMPNDTFSSIISVFNVRFNLYIVKENTKKMLSSNDIDFTKVFDDKTVIFINSGEKTISEGLLPLFISQIYSFKNNKSKFNILISDFENYKPIQNIAKMLNYSINKGICFTLFISGFNSLERVYGKEGISAIESLMTNIIYLLSNDISTLEEINKLCGMKDNNNSLISIDELKTIKTFESVIITVRSFPFKTKLMPYYIFKK